MWHIWNRPKYFNISESAIMKFRCYMSQRFYNTRQLHFLYTTLYALWRNGSEGKSNGERFTRHVEDSVRIPTCAYCMKPWHCQNIAENGVKHNSFTNSQGIIGDKEPFKVPSHIGIAYIAHIALSVTRFRKPQMKITFPNMYRNSPIHISLSPWLLTIFDRNLSSPP